MNRLNVGLAPSYATLSYRPLSSLCNLKAWSIKQIMDIPMGTNCALLIADLKKANTSVKETSFLDLNIKVIGSNVNTSVCDKRDDFGIPIINFPWLDGDVPRLPSYGIYILQLVSFARCCTSVLDFNYKDLQITSKLLIQSYIYHKLRKHLESYQVILWAFVQIW